MQAVTSGIKGENFSGQGSRRAEGGGGHEDGRVKPEEESRRLKDKSRRGPLSSTNAYSKLKTAFEKLARIGVQHKGARPHSYRRRSRRVSRHPHGF